MSKVTVPVPNLAPPVGPYSPVLCLGPWCFISGQIPLKNDGTLVKNNIEEEVRQVLSNLHACLMAAKLDWKHVVKINIYTTDLDYFDCINRIYSEVVCAPFPARAAVEVSALPKGARIEMDAMAYVE